MVLSDNTQVNDNQINSLKSFKIYGLFGYKDIELPLEQQVVILIAENGSGKTTILNTIYYILEKNLEKLKQIDFKKIEVSFINLQNQIINSYISKNDIKNLMVKSLTKQARIYQYYLRNFGEYDQPNIQQEKDLVVQSRRLLSAESQSDEDELRWNQFTQIIKVNLSYPFFYFPTYRRIEEDLSSLGYEDIELEDSSTKLIQFGMDDVKKNFRQIQKDIKDTAFNLFFIL